MKNKAKVFKIIGMCLIMCSLLIPLLKPISVEATSGSIPTWVLDWNGNGAFLNGKYNEMFFWGVSGFEYSNFQFMPYNNSLRVRVDAIDIFSSFTVTLFNSSDTQIASRTVSPGSVQFLQFDNLNQNDTYYLRFSGTKNGTGRFFLTWNNIF